MATEVLKATDRGNHIEYTVPSSPGELPVIDHPVDQPFAPGAGARRGVTPVRP